MPLPASRTIAVFAAVSALLASSAASALQIKVLPGAEPDLSILELAGRFEVGDGLKVRAEINKIPQENKVVLHLRADGGGFPGEAMSIGRLIHRLGIGTVIPPNSKCTSPCPLAFVAGFDRRKNEASMIKHSSASLGVTTPSGSERKEQDFTYKDLDQAIADRQKWTLQTADYLQELGVDIDFLKFYLKPAPSGKVNYISNEELLDIGASIYDDNSNQLVDGMSLRRRRQ